MEEKVSGVKNKEPQQKQWKKLNTKKNDDDVEKKVDETQPQHALVYVLLQQPQYQMGKNKTADAKHSSS